MFERRWGQQRDCHQNSPALSQQPPLSARWQWPLRGEGIFHVLLMVPSLSPLCALFQELGMLSSEVPFIKTQKGQKPLWGQPCTATALGTPKGDPNIIDFLRQNKTQKYSPLKPSLRGWGCYLEWKTGRIHCSFCSKKNLCCREIN